MPAVAAPAPATDKLHFRTCFLMPDDDHHYRTTPRPPALTAPNTLAAHAKPLTYTQPTTEPCCHNGADPAVSSTLAISSTFTQEVSKQAGTVHRTNTNETIVIYSPPIGMRSAMSVSLCMFAGVSQKITHPNAPNAWFPSDNSAICYVLPVLWMTSCFRIMDHMAHG